MYSSTVIRLVIGPYAKAIEELTPLRIGTLVEAVTSTLLLLLARSALAPDPSAARE